MKCQQMPRKKSWGWDHEAKHIRHPISTLSFLW